MDKLDSILQYNIMFKRYIQFKTWSEIESEGYYTRSVMFKLHSRALEKLSNTETTL